MSDKFKDNKQLFGVYDNRTGGGFNVKVTDRLLENMKQLKEGGRIFIRVLKPESRTKAAEKSGKPIEQTIAAYVDYIDPSEQNPEKF